MDRLERLEKLRRLKYLRGFEWRPDALYPNCRARDAQLAPPGDWLVWLILSGRGWGKTRTGAEWVKARALEEPGTRWAIVAPTYADARDVCIEGESGLLGILPEDRVRSWNRSLGELTLSNGSKIKLFSADEPERLRGHQHHGAWCDELAAWRYHDTWTQLQLGLRLGEVPRTVVTTTPKPIPLVKDLLKRETVHVTRGSTFENQANLSAAALEEFKNRYEGTRIGRQELYGEVLEDVPGALWTMAMLDHIDHIPQEAGHGTSEGYRRVVVAIDPAVTSEEDSDETGIVAVAEGFDGDYYVLADRSLRSTPDGWCRVAADLAEEVGADLIVGEANNGGDMIEVLLRQVDPTIPYHKVTASRGKRMRAEPIAALYEQGKVHHVQRFDILEDQMCSWTVDAKGSPDRLDALVWGLTTLITAPTPKRVGLLVR